MEITPPSPSASFFDAVVRAVLTVLLATASLQGEAAVPGPHPESRTAAESQQLVLVPCELPRLAQPARCGALDVAEDPLHPRGRRLAIHVAVLPATDGTALRDPIVPLLGGPGESAIDAAAVFAEQWASLRRERDIVLVDQRGSGRSGAFGCNLHGTGGAAISLAHLFPAMAAAQCARRLRARVDLRMYTYVHYAHDLEQVRRALGYDALNLSSGSYGTRAAQAFMRTFPGSVRTAYLGSVIPLDVATPLTMARSAQHELDRVFDACEADTSCRRAFPALREEFRGIAARLDAGQVRVAVPGGTKVELPRGPVAEFLRSHLYRPAGAAEVPWLIHRAHKGDWAPIVEGILDRAQGMASALDPGLFLTITCNEDVAFIREADIAAASRDTFLGDYRVREQQAACRDWNSGGLPKGYRQPLRTSVPTLFVSGDRDAASPLWFTARVAPGFLDRVEIVARGQGHTEWNPCIAQLYERFVRSGATSGIDGSDCPAIPRPPFKTR